MELQLVSKETAILAKELGFNWNVQNYYLNNEEQKSYWSPTPIRINFNTRDEAVSCPEQELLAKWLRDVHSLDSIPIIRYDIEDNKAVKYYMTGFSEDTKHYEKYEDCLEQILLLGLNHLKQLKEEKQ